MSKDSNYQILIIGGGAAGITVASQLKKKNSRLKIAIIEPSDKHYYQPGWTLVGGGVFELEETVKNEQKVIPQGVGWIKDSATNINPEENEVTTQNGTVYGYEYLVVCPGITIDWDKIKGLKESLGKKKMRSQVITPKIPPRIHGKPSRILRVVQLFLPFPQEQLNALVLPKKLCIWQKKLLQNKE